MAQGETELMMVRRHVREGAAIIERQRSMVARLRASRLPSDLAETLLLSFEDIQRLHIAHLARLVPAG